MDALLELLLPLVIHWRVGLATLAASLLAFVVVNAVPSLTGAAGVVLVLLGFGAGLLWETAAAKSKNE